MLSAPYFLPLGGGSYFGESGSSGTPGTLEIKLRLGSDSVAPFIWPHLCDKITVDWTDPNISSCKAYLEGQDGTRVLLNDNEPGVAKYRPSGQTTEYAGSWTQDFGANGVTDAGIDHAPTTGGISGGNMANWELATAFQMLADRTATYLVWVADVDDVSLLLTVKAPKLEYTGSANRKIVRENAHQAAIIHPSGPGVRFAGFNTGTSGTINNPPAIYDGFERPNVVDWLVFERLLVRGVAHNDGLTTELTSLYDSYEGNSVGQVRTASHGFLLPVTNSTWNIALVNSLSEVPPLAGFPRRRRSQTTWLETGVDFVQHSYAGMQSPDYFVNPSQGVELRTDDDVTVWTSSSSGVTGWAVTQHEEPVANDETDFGMWLGDRFAELRPFRGHYSVVPPLAGSVGVAIAVRSDWYIAYGRINDSGTVALRFAYAGQAPGDELDTEQSAVNLSMAWDKGQPGRLVMALETSGGNINVVASQDEGEIWTLATTVATGPGNTYPALTITPDGVRHVYWINGGNTIKGRLYNSAMTAFGAAFTVKTGVDDSGLAVDNARAAGGVATIEMAHIESGAVVVSRSTDGETFV